MDQNIIIEYSVFKSFSPATVSNSCFHKGCSDKVRTPFVDEKSFRGRLARTAWGDTEINLEAGPAELVLFATWDREPFLEWPPVILCKNPPLFFRSCNTRFGFGFKFFLKTSRSSGVSNSLPSRGSMRLRCTFDFSFLGF